MIRTTSRDKFLADMENILKNFTEWTAWASRSELDLSKPGVYILGRFDQGASGKPLITDPIVYIGETCGQSLRSRLGQFKRSAFMGKAGHSGGRTFASKFKAKKEPARLYISVLCESRREPQSSAYIRYVERALLWEYVQINKKKLPKCNRK